MKNDIATALVTAIVGVFLAIFISNMVIGNFSKSTDEVMVIDSSVKTDLDSPNNEVFNYKSLNPTVEVYVGDCEEVDMYGECVDESSQQINQGIIEEIEESSESNNSDNSNSGTNSSSGSGNSSQNQRNRQNGTSD